MNMEDYIEKTNNANSADELFRIFEETMSELGLDRIIFSLMTDHISLKKNATHGIVRNYPEHWMDYYTSANYEDIDPVRTKMFSSSIPFSWRELVHSGQLTESQMRVMLEGEESGLYCGVGIPLRSARGALAGVGAASTDRNFELTPARVSQANLISYQFYICYLSIVTPSKKSPIVILSERECDVLKWSAKGKTKHEIGMQMCLSKHTVDYHTRHILIKLNTNNITTAVVKALNQGLIQV